MDDAALAQINDMDYVLAFAVDPRAVFKIGVGFDSNERMISGWKMEVQDCQMGECEMAFVCENLL